MKMKKKNKLSPRASIVTIAMIVLLMATACASNPENVSGASDDVTSTQESDNASISSDSNGTSADLETTANATDNTDTQTQNSEQGDSGTMNGDDTSTSPESSPSEGTELPPQVQEATANNVSPQELSDFIKNYLPYKTESYQIAESNVPGQGVFITVLSDKDEAAAVSDAKAWIKSKGIDPASILVTWGSDRHAFY